MIKKRRKQKHVFWQALILASLIFGSGILLGYILENNRTNKIESLFQQTELEFLDLRATSQFYSLQTINCEESTKELINFADRIYNELLKLREYEKAQRITKELFLTRKKYDILRTSLWLDSIAVRKRCPHYFDNVVYLYSYQPTLEKKAKQRVFSRILADLKQDLKNKILLIPIAADINITTLDILKRSYNITDLPVIVINEDIKVYNIESEEEIKNLL
ncbi:hypothetical protein B6U80_01385 [Candidatus Pacearchaeota archaeon ex4484_26]|nr:MAG: hypothetical protein B6U80_01385 [Candidatus Pacearchaeota archaeon ex4484_26]